VSRSPEGFSELIRKCGEKAFNLAFRLSGNEPDARDLVQEAFVRAYAHFETYDETRPFETWLFRILHNVYLDGVRRFSHSRTVSLDAPAPVEDSTWEEIIPSDDPEPAAGMMRREADGLLQKALGLIPLHYRTAVVLCDMEGMSYEEIGKIMSCPVGTVRSRIHQGRQLLRQAFENLERGGLAQ